jgi:N-acetylglucosamine kinase-like BadF-type ATPase
MAMALGIDAGGTATRAILLDDERVAWEADGGPANLATGDAGALPALLAGCPQPDAVCGAFAGLVSDELRAQAVSLLREAFPAAKIAAVADFEAALEACSPHANVCVIAGTGSIVCSRHGDEVKRTGGRGYVLGDEGSGFQFGRDAMLSFLDGSDETISSELCEAIEGAFGTRSRGEAIAALYAQPGIAGRLASLAPALAHDAENGAIYALKSLRTNMAKLAHVARRHLRRYEPLEPIIGCQGGLWKSPAYRKAFVEAVPLWCELPPERVVFDLPEPALGAAALARRLL